MNRRNFLGGGTALVGTGVAVGVFPPTLLGFEPRPIKMKPGFELIATFHDEITGLCEYEGSIFVATGTKVYRINKEMRWLTI